MVFADPPYALADAAVSQVLSLLAGQGWLAPGALVIVERATRSGPLNWPDGFVPDRARRYGEATFWYGLAPKPPTGAQGARTMTGKSLNGRRAGGESLRATRSLSGFL